MDRESIDENDGTPGEPWARTIGAHTMSLEPPDIVFLRISGDIDETHVGPISEELVQIAGRLPYVFGLIDMSRMGTITPAARKVAASAKKPANVTNAVFGA